MRFDKIELFHVRMPLIFPWRTAYGEDAAIESVLARVTSDGVQAWGESCPLAAPCYSPEYAGGVFQTARQWFAPALLGIDLKSGEQLQQALSLFKGNPFAKALFDTAWWSLQSQITGRPLHRLLGATRDLAEVGADFGIKDSIGQLLDAIEPAVRGRFPRIKLKFRPGWDIPMLEAVRNRFPDAVFHIDCNSGYTLRDTALFQEIDRFNLAMIEQPLRHDDLHDHAALARTIRTPVCLDESITSVERARQAIELGSARYINIKPGRVGGLTVAKQIHDLCASAHIPCWVGGMLESAVGAQFCASLAMLDNFTYPADIFASSTFYQQDLAEPAITLSHNAAGVPCIEASSRPGNASVPDLGRLAGCTLQSAVIS
jgi:O-succinylbenzoate synthase